MNMPLEKKNILRQVSKVMKIQLWKAVQGGHNKASKGLA